MMGLSRAFGRQGGITTARADFNKSQKGTGVESNQKGKSGFVVLPTAVYPDSLPPQRGQGESAGSGDPNTQTKDG